MKDDDNPNNRPPINPKLVSAYMAFIGHKGGTASARLPRLHFTTEHQQRAALARWQQHNQRKDQLINESKKQKAKD